MNPPEPKAELLELCNRLLDGGFTPTDRERLEELVLSDSGLRREYVEFMHLNAVLRQNASRLGDVSLSEVLSALPEAEPPAKVIRLPHWTLQIAAVVSLGFGLWWFGAAREEKPWAKLVETNGARWESSSLPTDPGSALKAGRFRLAQGVARMVFRSGAEISLEGPAELELTGPNACFLHSGALVAHVPEQARGFVVGTANAQLVDYGTDFGISADSSGRAQVRVMQGEVELQHERSGEKLRLLTREAAAITPDRFTAAKEVETEPDRYAFRRAESEGKRPSLTLTTAGGNGDAGYATSPGSKIHFSDTLLLVKNAPTKSYLRKAFLRFDLASLRGRRVADASLTLNFETTGFGYASLTDSCTFAVYGLTDDSQDAWSGDTLDWEKVPAFSPEPGAVNIQRAMKLGTFTTPRGVVSGVFGIDGPQLAEFLNRDANHLATIIVVRETSIARDGAVHGFAGNRHPTLAPPTLRVVLE